MEILHFRYYIHIPFHKKTLPKTNKKVTFKQYLNIREACTSTNRVGKTASDPHQRYLVSTVTPPRSGVVAVQLICGPFSMLYNRDIRGIYLGVCGKEFWNKRNYKKKLGDSKQVLSNCFLDVDFMGTNFNLITVQKFRSKNYRQNIQ